MTDLRDHPCAEGVQKDRAVAWLGRGDLRPTRQRVTLARLLVGDGGNRHVTAEELYALAEEDSEKVSLATVYNTLRAFCDAGLMREIMVSNGRSYFDTRTEDHPHFFSEDDGSLSDAPAAELQIAQLPAPPDGTEIAKVDVVIRVRRT